MGEEDVLICLRVLGELADAPADDPDLIRVRQAVSVFAKKTRGCCGTARPWCAGATGRTNRSTSW